MRELHHLAASPTSCGYRGCGRVDQPTHACYNMNTGNAFGGDRPSARDQYGLGPQTRPAGCRLPEVNYPQGGAANWSSGYLPPHFQGTPLRPTGSPILDLAPPPGVTTDAQRRNLDLLKSLNDGHRRAHPHHAEPAARMEAYELAFRMQAQVPGVVDLDGEDEAVKHVGVARGHRRLRRPVLMARRTGERGAASSKSSERVGLARLPGAVAHARSRRRTSHRGPDAALKSGDVDDTLVGGPASRPPRQRRARRRQGRGEGTTQRQAMTVGRRGGRRPGTGSAPRRDRPEAASRSHPIRDMQVTLRTCSA